MTIDLNWALKEVGEEGIKWGMSPLSAFLSP